MQCPACQAVVDEDAEACFQCGLAVFALTRGTVLAGRYEILKPLGRGGMGRVYEARDRVMEEHVALKVLRSEFMRDPEMSRRFVSEIKLARKIGHRNVCRIHEYGEEGGIRYIVMELIQGVTLKELLRDGPPPPEAAYDLAVQVARGLNAVHELGIVHRDFKAANIMIDAAGVAKLVDFGIAKDLSSERTGPTVAGMLMGTPEYMSPEQAKGQPVGFRSDIYALGCVVYEIFTGHAPFRGATPVATVFMHLHEQLPVDGEDAARLPPALLPVLRRALAKDPFQRYASVGDFAEALVAACAAGGYALPAHRGGLRLPASHAASLSGGDTASLRPAASRRRAIRLMWLVAAAAAVLAVAVVYLGLFGTPPSAPLGSPSPALADAPPPTVGAPARTESPLPPFATPAVSPEPAPPLAPPSSPPAVAPPMAPPTTAIARPSPSPASRD